MTMDRELLGTMDHRVARPKIEDRITLNLGPISQELRTNTFSGSEHEDVNEHIEKVLEIVDLFHIPNITIDQSLDSRGAIPSKTVADAKIAIQEMAEYSQKWHNETSRLRSTKTSNGLAVIQAQLNNLGREIKKVNEKVYAAQVGCEQCKGPHYTKDCPLKEEGKTLEEAYYTQFGGPFQGGGYRAAAPGFYQRNNANPSYQERRQSMEDTLSKFMSESAKRHEENSNLIKEIRASTDAAIRNQGASIKTLEIQIGQMSKVLQERGFGSLPSSTEANPRDQVKSISTTIEADSCPIRRIGSSQYAVSTGQNRTLMYETRQTTILFPSRLNGYYCEEKKGSYGPQFSEAYSEASHISIPRKEKDPREFNVYLLINKYGGPGNNVIGPLMNVPIIVETFSIVTDFAVLESMDAYHDERMGDVIFGEPFLREVGIDTRRFEGMITIYNGDDEVTYQMVRSHPWFKHHTNEQCNKIPPLLKVSEEDKINGISHPYQKLKGFYKGVLNLGTDYIRDAKMEKWLTRGHISVHEME
ncbi:hypothetical protein Tco_0454773 [Tanacetum coccineum]